VPLPRTSWRRRPLLVLIILLLLLVIGYAVRALDGNDRSGSRPAGSHASTAQPAPAAQDGGRLAAKAAMPSCACSLAK
jgi:hypothetical protein